MTLIVELIYVNVAQLYAHTLTVLHILIIPSSPVTLSPTRVTHTCTPTHKILQIQKEFKVPHPGCLITLSVSTVCSCYPLVCGLLLFLFKTFTLLTLYLKALTNPNLLYRLLLLI